MTKDEYPNKFTEKDIENFTTKKLSGEQYEYKDFHCGNSYTARMKYHSSSECYSVDFGNGISFILDDTQVGILYDWFNRLFLSKSE